MFYNQFNLVINIWDVAIRWQGRWANYSIVPWCCGDGAAIKLVSFSQPANVKCGLNWNFVEKLGILFRLMETLQ